jgi:hypothetical protein
MFASVGYAQHPLLRAVREATGCAPLTGCSGEGTIGVEDADESNFSVVVTAISSEELHWHNGIATGLEDKPRTAGKLVADELLPHLSADTIGLFVFPDGMTDNLEPFFAGLEGNLSLERFLPLWGGGLATTSARGSQPISTATTKSLPRESPTPCSRARRKLPGPSATV